METSSIFKINGKDLLKGLFMAVVTAIVTGLINGLDTGTFAFTWEFFKPVVISSVTVGLVYILKNWLQNSNGDLLKKE